VHEHRRAGARALACAVVTVSDTRTHADDRSGDAVVQALSHAGHGVAAREIVPDDPMRVAELVCRLCADDGVDAVILTGGTGLAPRDSTYEAIAGLLDKRIDGFGELFRMLSYSEIGAAAMLSRAVAGLVGVTPVFALPGSTAACLLAMEKLVAPELGHLVALVDPRRGRR